MRTVCLTFTYPKDAEKAALCGALVPPDWDRVWCVEPKHAEMPVPHGVKKLVADFPRGGTLRHKPAILGMAEVFSGFSGACECLVKLDSDTVIWRPEAFTAPVEHSDADFVFIRRWKNEDGYANGNAYALSRRALGRMAMFGGVAGHGLTERYYGHEDRVFSAFLIERNTDLTACPLKKEKCHWHAKKYARADCVAAHYGYVHLGEVRDEIAGMCRALGRDIPDISGYLEKLKNWAEK